MSATDFNPIIDPDVRNEQSRGEPSIQRRALELLFAAQELKSRRAKQIVFDAALPAPDADVMKFEPLVSRVELQDELCSTLRSCTRQHALYDTDVRGGTRVEQAQLGLVEQPEQSVVGPCPARIFYFLRPRLITDPRRKGSVGDLSGWK